MNILDLSLGNNIFCTDTLSAALQEIDLVFNTTQTELLGDYKYGSNFEQFLWTMTPNTDDVRRYIQEKLDNSFFLSQLRYDVNVQYLEGDYRGIYYVRISVYVGSKTGTREYQFQ